MSSSKQELVAALAEWDQIDSYREGESFDLNQVARRRQATVGRLVKAARAVVTADETTGDYFSQEYALGCRDALAMIVRDGGQNAVHTAQQALIGSPLDPEALPEPVPCPRCSAYVKAHGGPSQVFHGDRPCPPYFSEKASGAYDLALRGKRREPNK